MKNTFLPSDNGFYLKNIYIKNDSAVLQIYLNSSGLNIANYLKNYLVGVYLKQNDQLWAMDSHISGNNTLEAEIYYETIARNILSKPKKQAALYVRTRIGNMEYDHPVCVMSDKGGFLIEFGFWDQNRFCLIPVSPWDFYWSQDLDLVSSENDDEVEANPESGLDVLKLSPDDYKKFSALYIEMQGCYSSQNGAYITFYHKDEGWPVYVDSILFKKVNTDIIYTAPVKVRRTDSTGKLYTAKLNLEIYKNSFQVGVHQLFAIVHDGSISMELPVKTFREVIPCENMYFLTNPTVLTVNGAFHNLLFYNDTSLNLKAKITPKYLRGQIDRAEINNLNLEFSIILQNEAGFTKPTAVQLLGTLSGPQDVPFHLLSGNNFHKVSFSYNLKDLYEQMPDEDIRFALNYRSDFGVLPLQNNWYGKREAGRENFSFIQIVHLQNGLWFKVNGASKKGAYTLRISEDLEMVSLIQIEAEEDSLKFLLHAFNTSGIDAEEEILEYDGRQATLLFVSKDIEIRREFIWHSDLASITVPISELSIADYDLWCLFPDGKKSRIVMRGIGSSEIYRNESEKIIARKSNGKLNIEIIELLLYETKEKKKQYTALAQRALDEYTEIQPPVWLIGENYGLSARDNGLVFFEYCIREGFTENIFFVTKQDNPDLDRLNPYIDNVLFYDSPEHIYYDAIAEYYIVSHGIRDVLPSLYHNNLSSGRKPIIYLQHGIAAMKKFGINSLSYGGVIEKFCVSSQFERKLLERQNQFYGSEIVVTGLARYDLFSSPRSKRKYLWIMPTWRDWLATSTEEFLRSDFYKNYAKILSSPVLLDVVQEYGYKVIFSLHIEFEKYKPYFSQFENENIKIMDMHQTEISTLVQECCVMVTDYSSVAFDVLYMDTPVIFFQFDRDLYEADRGSYINLDEDLPGAVAKTPEETIKHIIDCLHRNCVIEEKYRIQKEKFFDFHDSENSKRIYESIIACRKEHE